VRALLLVALALTVTTAAGCGGSTAVGECSNGTFDGQGGCIPSWHAPARVEAAAIGRFHGQEVDRVGCYVRGELRYRGRAITLWGWWRVAGGILTHDLVCVAASHGRPLGAALRAAVPARRLRCGTSP
jgi:hypothetical protein